MCEYFPCHSGISSNFSCELCYCPEYLNPECSGKPKWIGEIKDCSDCLVNHSPEYVTNYYKEKKNV